MISQTSDHYVHDLNPVFFAVGPIQIRYYSLSYLLGLLLAWWLLRWLSRRKRIALNPLQVSDLIAPYALLGVLVGGRLGYVLFYKFGEYVSDPLSVFKIWEGGMASHGGIAGVAVALALFSRSRKIPFTHLMDCCALVAPMGLFLGRVANFINGELWGRGPTDVAWGVIFPASHAPHDTPFARHPSQIYEALGEGLILFLVLFALHRSLLRRPGAISGLFIALYGIARIVCERYREPDRVKGGGSYAEFEDFGITRGQLLTGLMMVFAAVLLIRAARSKPVDWEPQEETQPET